MKRVLLGVSAMVLAALPAAPAAAMSVEPVVLDLKPSGPAMSRMLTVDNTGVNDVTVDLTVEGIDPTANGFTPTGKDPGDLLVFPPQAVIAPGQKQTFRVQYVGDPALATSRHYYVSINQLPIKLPEGTNAVQLLYDFKVITSVSPADVKPQFTVTQAQIGKEGDGKPIALISVHNTSAAHGYLANGHLRLIERDAAGKQVFTKNLSSSEIAQAIGLGLVAAGQTRQIAVPVVLPQSQGNLEASFAFD